MAAQPSPQPPRPQLPPTVQASTSPPTGSAALKTRARAPLLTGSSDVHKVAQPSLLSGEEYAGAPCRRPVSDPTLASVEPLNLAHSVICSPMLSEDTVVVPASLITY